MSEPSKRAPRLRALRAQALVELLTLELAPAAAVAAVLATHVGLPEALVGFVATALTAHLLARSAYAPHLLSVARIGMRANAPILGGAAAALFSVLGGHGARLGDVVVAVIGAWLVLLVGMWVKSRLDAQRPVRVAVLSAGLSAALGDELRTAGIRSYEVIGWIAAESQAFPHQISGGPDYLGKLDDVRRLVGEHRIDLLVSCPVHGDERSRLRTLEIVGSSCLDLPVRMLELSQLYEDLLGHVPLGASDAAWFQYLLNPKYRPGSAVAKRAFDIACATAMLAIAAPAIALAALAIKLEDGGPVLYRQRRLGLGRDGFTMLKLRSMSVGADAGEPASWSAAADPRVTRVGRLLRRTHVDELPQLWNVLRGEMSMVGPRPEQPEIAPALEQRFSYYKCRYLLKPGVTGWAQVRCGYGGSEMGSANKLCHDLFYLKHRSTLSDLLIMVETARMVAGGNQYAVRRARDSFIAEGKHAGDKRMIESEATGRA
ncbi:MAG: hypothetical protein QOG09_1039 [Solirubrobacterales bacterium]|nr:hypothetical protein [Solirubrobacterales bacterium]